MVVLVLDELDQLLRGDAAVLYELFRLPQARAAAAPLTCGMHAPLLRSPAVEQPPDPLPKSHVQIGGAPLEGPYPVIAS
jgi:hypothetical protein